MDIRPFSGWHYRGPDVSTQIAPPYDVLNRKQKEDFLAGDSANIVAVDLPHVPPSGVGPDKVYRDAAKVMQMWQDQGVLCHDEKPAVYAYQQDYTWAGVSYSRRALLAGVHGTPLGVDVMPHEHTFAGPKADRLKLTTATRMQLSPIFGFFKDPSAGLIDRIWSRLPGDGPALTGTLEGVVNKLWVITDPGDLDDITSTLAAEKVYIADGHHRYTTALNYADALEQAGIIDPDHPARYVLFALVERDDPGLLVLPTHRVVRGLADFDPDALVAALGENFTVTPFTGLDDLSDADAFLAPQGEHALAMLAGDRVWTVRLKNPAAMEAACPDAHVAYRQLDVAILQALILDGPLQQWTTDETEITYTPHGNEAWSDVREGRAEAAFILQHTPLAAVQAIADANESMPHKSTYFYPKIATGMILKPLD